MSTADFSELRGDIRNSRLWDSLSSMSGAELLALHSWHNENNSHSLAFQALSLAIAKGLSASKNYSFASASLRKLGRLAEARGFGVLALDLDPNNLDAKYNLALILRSMGDREAAVPLAEEIYEKAGEYHRNRIQQEFSEFGTFVNPSDHTIKREPNNQR